MNLKNKALFGSWISFTGKAYRRNKIMGEKNLSYKFEDWLQRV